MVIGVLIGKFFPKIPDFLNRFEYANVSIPMAILIWLMIYPMMMKVDFPSIRNVGKKPKGLWITWITTFVPIVKFLLGVSNVSVPWDTLPHVFGTPIIFTGRSGTGPRPAAGIPGRGR